MRWECSLDMGACAICDQCPAEGAEAGCWPEGWWLLVWAVASWGAQVHWASSEALCGCPALMVG